MQYRLFNVIGNSWVHNIIKEPTNIVHFYEGMGEKLKLCGFQSVDNILMFILLCIFINKDKSSSTICI